VKIRRYLQRKEIVEYLKKTKKEAAKIKLQKKRGKGKKDEVDELEERMNKFPSSSSFANHLLQGITHSSYNGTFNTTSSESLLRFFLSLIFDL
jgi:hypothetical protein